jgi:hypothetical protein
MNGTEPDVGASDASPRPIDADAHRIGELTLVTWQRFEAALAPIIGRGGVAALYRRSLFLSHTEHPWLPGAQVGALDPVEFTELQAAMARRPSHEAQAATDALTSTFRDLLAELIGLSLTDRLLRPAPIPPSHGGPVQENLP